ncbi:MAG TPA: transglycosylase SLT domain-containing protein [Mesorhizobium sp.]|uniref:transglycosylase SLT domain-containing protein n=1 Tax=Mesorhizobium sp. TaxID=1871066 RepID=UPI002DDCD207|nr:transglycosylase SLT domain-containing protein [Mesorhizobium sp.]HEV2505573.1 transglycosylase SLT domain-containing protein [Mesorhizobium sp.]
MRTTTHTLSIGILLAAAGVSGCTSTTAVKPSLAPATTTVSEADAGFALALPEAVSVLPESSGLTPVQYAALPAEAAGNAFAGATPQQHADSPATLATTPGTSARLANTSTFVAPAPAQPGGATAAPASVTLNGKAVTAATVQPVAPSQQTAQAATAQAATVQAAVAQPQAATTTQTGARVSTLSTRMGGDLPAPKPKPVVVASAATSLVFPAAPAAPKAIASLPGVQPVAYSGPVPTYLMIPEPEAERPGPVSAGRGEVDRLITKYAALYEVPVELVRSVVKRESTFNPLAYNNGHWGLMQIKHATARGMGYGGAPKGLFDAETNLKYAVKYLRGAFLVANGDYKRADRLYQTGYYYDAKRKGLLEETGLGRDRKRKSAPDA